MNRDIDMTVAEVRAHYEALLDRILVKADEYVDKRHGITAWLAERRVRDAVKAVIDEERASG